MQNFAKSKIALAVGTGLMVMAGSSYAVSGAPIARAVKPALAAPLSQPNADALYATTGFSGALPVTMNFTAPADTLSAGGFALLSAGTDGLQVNAANAAATTVGASVATDDIAVYAGTAGATQINLMVSNVGFVANVSTATNAQANFRIETTAPEALRVNPTTGALEYTADNAAAAIAWLPVSLAVQVDSGAGNAISAQDGSGATAITAIAGQSVFNTVAPTMVARTRKTAGAALIDGVEIDTVTPLAAAIVVGSATTGVTFTSNVAGCSPSTTDANNAADIAAVAAVAPATGLTSTLAGSVATLTFAGATTDWTTGAAAVDTAAYVSNCFNTGVAGGSLPFTLAFTGTAANLPTYSLVFNANSGAAQTVGALPAIVDGAAPVVTAAVLDPAVGTTTPLKLTFSEPMSLRTAAGVGSGLSLIREVAENVMLGADSLAALNLNAGGTLGLSDADGNPNAATVAALGAGNTTALGVTNGTSTLVIEGIQTADLTGKTVSVTSGIALQEANDSGFVAGVSALDIAGTRAGGLFSTSGVVEGSTTATALTPTAAPVLIAFSDSTANAATTTADVSKIGLISVNFPAGKGVGYRTGKTFADLTGQIVVTVTGNSAAGTPVSFDFFPTAIATGNPAPGQMVLTASTAGASNSLTINPPTDLIYSKITSLTPGSVVVTYQNLAAADVLVGTITAAPVVSAGQETVNLPLSATATLNTLVTQSITGQLTGASSGSKVAAYLADWIESSTTAITASVGSGRISSPGDRVATDLAIEFADAGALGSAIAAQLNVSAAKAPVAGVSDAVKAGTVSPIPVYVKLVRSNDVVSSSKGAAATSSGSGNGQNYLEARAILATTYAGAKGTSTANVINGVDGEDPVYEVNLDPRTGNITGRLVGNVRITTGSTVVTSRGLDLLNGGSPDAQGLVDGTGRFNLLVGIDPDTAEIAAGSRGVANRFVILVHEDQANTRRFTQLTSGSPGALNFLPFDPNLYNLKGTRTVVGVGGIATPTVNGAAGTPILLSNYLVNTPANSTNWALMGLRNPAFSAANAAPGNFVRHFIGTNSVTGVPESFWTSDGNTGDMALALTGNRMSLATELGNTATLSTFGPGSFLTGAAALAWNNDGVSVNDRVTFAQAPAPSSVRVPRGWSLVTVPTAGLNTASIDAVMRVGAQAASQFTWIKSTDGTLPTLTAGEAVFVFSNAGTGNL